MLRIGGTTSFKCLGALCLIEYSYDLQFEYEFEHIHPGHQHPQHLQGHAMFARPPHGPGFRPGGPPLGHFGFGSNPTLGPGAGAGMDFSMFTDNGHGHNAGLERPKKVRHSTSALCKLVKGTKFILAACRCHLYLYYRQSLVDQILCRHQSLIG